MGMFSTLLHEGREYQFKTGFDDALGRYKLGDKIEWEPDPYWPGSHIDGVHDACTSIDGSIPDVWVVIRDCTIIAVEPRQYGADRDRAFLEAKYEIRDPDPKLWTEAQWKAKADREAKAEAEYQAWAKIHGDDPVGYYMHCKMREKSVFEQIMPARKVSP